MHDSSYSAVVVHDYSAVTNNVEFQDCDFDVMSTVGLLFSLIDDEKIKTNGSENYVVRKCSFGEREPMQELISICVKATDSHAHFQKIILTECKFTKSLGSTWIIRISYCINHHYGSKGYPSTAIEIDRCVFAVRFPIKFNLRQESQDFFLKHNYLPAGNFPKILMIKHTRFEQAIVEINGPQNSRIEWRYMEVSRISVSDTEFLNCSITVDSQIKVVKSHVMLTNCHLFNSTLTPVIAENSEIAVQGQNLFEQNRGECGGAIKLKNSTLLLLPNSETIISRNVADFGGGIYVKQPEYSFYRYVEVLKKYCTIINSINLDKGQIQLYENQALNGGSSIFGEEMTYCVYNCTGLRHCKVRPDLDSFGQHVPKYIGITPYSNHTKYTEISSPANRICLCNNHEPTDECEVLDVTAFPGQEFSISLIALGKSDGSVPVTLAAITSLKINIGNRIHFLSVSCTAFSFLVRSIDPKANLQMIDLKISEDTPTPIGEVYDRKLVVRVHLLPCPPGTILSSVSHQCECRDFLKKFDIQCDNKRGKVHVKNNQWIGYFNNSQLAVSNNYVLDYLFSIDKFFSLSTPDVATV